MTYLPGLLIALVVFWLALSGQTAPLFLGLGALSVLLTLWLCGRLKVLGREASPYHRVPQIAWYCLWLGGEVVKANISVIPRVIGPRHAIDPAMVSVRTRARSDLGKAVFANSITLTPGTVTVDVDGDRLKVHALVRENAGTASFEPMDRRASVAADPARRKG